MAIHFKTILFTAIYLCSSLIPQLYGAPDPCFRIRIVDAETGRGIPLVEVRTQNYIRYYSDSNGLIAFREPGLMDQDLYLFISSEGYDYPKDILGNSGFVINAAENDSIVIRLQRRNIAERLYRITGQGIYGHSDLLNEPVPLKNPLLNGKVLGQDSNLRTIYRNRIFWFWGDTFKPAYPWGNFSVSGAVSFLPADGGLSPEKGIDLEYFVDSTGFSRPMIKLDDPGFVWLDWVLPVKDDDGKEQLVAKYARVKSDFTNHERGIAVFDDRDNQFKKYKQIDAWLNEYHTTNHLVPVRIGNKTFTLMTSQFEYSRVEPDLDRLCDPDAYEYFSCLKPGSKYDAGNPVLDRDDSGRLIWGWKRSTDPVGLSRQNELVASGKIDSDERWFCLDDIATGAPLDLQRGSVYFNQQRKRWILIIQKNVGEIWYAEADTPIGPWVFGKKVLEHDQFFYNPVHHPFFDEENGRIIYFEGTYTNTFSGNPLIVPGYEYNQLLYRLDLDDPRLYLPAPVYRTKYPGKNDQLGFGVRLSREAKANSRPQIAFMAFEPGRHHGNLIPVYQQNTPSGPGLSVAASGAPLFYALPADTLPFEKFLGSWQCHMTDGIFLNRNFMLEFSLADSKLVASVPDAGYTVSQIFCLDDSIGLSAQYVDKIYHFSGRRQGSMLTGKWSSPDGSARGTWQADIDDHKWQIVHAPGLTGLYEYHNAITGVSFYSVNDDLTEPGFQRSDKPLCRVWTYPSDMAAYDFDMRPSEIE